MTNETRKRIEAYEKLLPDMKERVMAVAILLVMSVSMMISASFAWITLSRAPEAVGMQTTVAANGSLEIALAQGLMKEELVAPGESQVGDSSAAEGQSIVAANATWGNLVNVSDPVYGLSKIALRPALLSSYNRTEYPLNGATYGEDGRVVTTNDRYEFTSYEKVATSDTEYFFAAGDEVTYGVRAISSIGYKNISGNVRIDNFRNDTNQLYMEAQNYYGQIVAEKPNEVNTLNSAAGVTCISALEGLVTVFAQDKINEMGLGPSGASGQTSCSPYIWYTYQMTLLLQEALEKEGKALLEMANWQAYVSSGDAKVEKSFETIEALTSASSAVLKEKGVTLTTLEGYKKSVKELKTCVDGLKPMAEKCKNPDAPEVDYYWEDIATYVNILVHVNTTTMNGIALQNASASNALKLIGGGDVVVYKGTLVDIEKRFVNNDNRVQANVQVSVKTSIMGNMNVDGTVYTDAFGAEPAYATDLAYSDSMQSGAKGDATQKDNYGLALDLWVKTNYPDAVLTLEGAAIYEEQRASATIDGVEYELYTISVGDENLTTEVDVYQKDDKWYYLNTMEEVNTETLGEQEPKEKYESVIIGYEGENRIWSDWRDLLEGGYIEQDATTQGAGSCFVFYADTPTEQAKIMEMLEAFNVAFMDQNGNILGTAQLNLNSAYSNQGKVTVPLEVVIGTDYTDEAGITHKGITRLTANTPTFITAIVYLNGSKLQNANVLAEGELQGQLNIQFGTDSVLIAPDNEELQSQSRTITAEVTVGNETVFDGTIGGTSGLDYKAEGYKAKVVLTVEGEQPENISGSFIRVINSTQGTKDEDKKFIYDSESGKWVAEFTLKNPGTYAFNTIMVDGVQYTLHDGTKKSGMNEYYPSNRPYVYINGLKVETVNIGLTAGTYMTAEASKTIPVTVKIDAAVMPKQVNAQFFNTDNTKQYSAILKYDEVNEQWVGAADIRSSDTYTLKYVSVDGDTLSVPTTGSYTFYLGLRASVSTTISEDDRFYDFKNQATQFPMLVKIYDDGGKTIEGLSNVKLYYSNIISPATMTWNGTYYEGVLDATRAGQMQFSRLELGGAGAIYNVTGAPVFMARSLEKPEYVSGSAKTSKATIIQAGTNATMDVILKNGESAVVWAELQKVENNNSEVRYVEGVRYSENQNAITFTLPREDGVWTLKRLLLQNVYDKDAVYEDENGNVVTGKDYPIVEGTPTDENSFVLLPKENEQFTTDVVVSCNVDVFYNGQKMESAFKETFGSATADFMSIYHSKKLEVKVYDYAGRSIDLLESVTWTINHETNSMQTYGGYKGPGRGVNTITLTENANDSTKYEVEPQEFRVAGKYTSEIHINLANGIVLSSEYVPSYTVESKHPMLSIESILPNGSHNTVTTGKSNKTVHSKFEGNTITIFPESRVEGSGCDQKGVLTTEPRVILKFTGLGNADNATLTFTEENNGTVRLYSGSNSKSGTQTNAYVWDSSTGESVRRWIGYNDAGSCDSSTAAGRLTSANVVTMKYGDETYEIPIEAIKIINVTPD